jgi:hypothetical protein
MSFRGLSLGIQLVAQQMEMGLRIEQELPVIEFMGGFV